MNIDIEALATEYSILTLLETRLAHNEFIIKTSDITQKKNSELIKIINKGELQDDMNLKSIVDSAIKTYDKVSDSARLLRGLMYYADGERYRLLRDEQTFRYFKRKCTQVFKKLSDPEIIKQYKEEMGSYLPKKYLK